MMSTIIILSTIYVESTMYETKKGTARMEPQLLSSSEHLPLSGRTIMSCISPFHDSPVEQRKRVSAARPKVQKFASRSRYLPCETLPKSCIPRSEYIESMIR